MADKPTGDEAQGAGTPPDNLKTITGITTVSQNPSQSTFWVVALVSINQPEMRIKCKCHSDDKLTVTMGFSERPKDFEKLIKDLKEGDFLLCEVKVQGGKDYYKIHSVSTGEGGLPKNWRKGNEVQVEFAESLKPTHVFFN